MKNTKMTTGTKMQLLLMVIVILMMLVSARVTKRQPCDYDFYDPVQMYEDVLMGTGALYDR